MDLDAFKSSKVAKEKVAKPRKSPATQIRMWSATCARRRATATALTDTPGRMAASANLQSPGLEPRQKDLCALPNSRADNLGEKGGKGKVKALSFRPILSNGS